MQKALIVKDNGLIYAAEVPEEPTFEQWTTDPVVQYRKMDYNAKLASAKENAVFVSNQEKAKALIWQYGDQHNKPIVKPGLVVPIPDLQWEVKESWGRPYHENICPEKVAILKESTPLN